MSYWWEDGPDGYSAPNWSELYCLDEDGSKKRLAVVQFNTYGRLAWSAYCTGLPFCDPRDFATVEAAKKYIEAALLTKELDR